MKTNSQYFNSRHLSGEKSNLVTSFYITVVGGNKNKSAERKSRGRALKKRVEEIY